MICEQAKDNGCLRRNCVKCDFCPQPFNPEKQSGVYYCDNCEQNHIISLRGKFVQLVTTRTPKEIEKLDQSARNDLRMYYGTVTDEYISDKNIKHDVCLDGLVWVSILDGMELRNVYVNKTHSLTTYGWIEE